MENKAKAGQTPDAGVAAALPTGVAPGLHPKPMLTVEWE